jgi:hypothetical protein
LVYIQTIPSRSHILASIDLYAYNAIVYHRLAIGYPAMKLYSSAPAGGLCDIFTHVLHAYGPNVTVPVSLFLLLSASESQTTHRYTSMFAFQNNTVMISCTSSFVVSPVHYRGSKNSQTWRPGRDEEITQVAQYHSRVLMNAPTQGFLGVSSFS